MATPNLDSFISQLTTKAVVAVVVAGVLGIVAYELRTRIEDRIDRMVRRWKSARQAKCYKGMSDDEILDAPRCPKCEGTMTLRTAWKGANEGEKFWGCNSFPKCKGTRQISRQ